jgi:hypothetical protein
LEATGPNGGYQGSIANGLRLSPRHERGPNAQPRTSDEVLGRLWLLDSKLAP